MENHSYMLAESLKQKIVSFELKADKNKTTGYPGG